MARLIDADELRRRIIAFFTGHNTTYMDAVNIGMMINQAETVDAVPIVRCRDCEYSRDLNTREKEIFIDVCLACENNDASQHGYVIVFPDHFCSYGERRNPNEEK